MTESAESLLEVARAALIAAGEPEVEIFLRATQRGIARFAIGELAQHMALDEPFASIRVAHGTRVAEAATSRVDRESLVRAIQGAAKAAKVVPETEGFPGFADATEAPGELPPRFAEATAQAGADERVDRLAPEMEKIAQRGLFSAGSLETRLTHQAVATTRGLLRSHSSTFANYKIWALETPGAGGASGFGADAHRDLSRLDLPSQTERAIHFCERGRNPGSLDAGTYDVVMEPYAVAELLEWLATIGFAAPELEQGTSPLAGLIGERITGEGITIVEDPLEPGDLGLATPFDREGVWRKPVKLIENGIARGVLYDRTYAARLGATSTGSALAPDGLSGGGIGACSLRLAGGSASSIDELVAGVDRGVYVCRLHYVNGFLEPRRAVMTGLTRDGCFLIEKGKIAGPIGNLRFTDSFLEGLARADGMTSSQRLVPTWWSEAGACITPAIRMRAFHFNGRSQEPPRIEG
jgi:PmbA protein